MRGCVFFIILCLVIIRIFYQCKHQSKILQFRPLAQLSTNDKLKLSIKGVFFSRISQISLLSQSVLNYDQMYIYEIVIEDCVIFFNEQLICQNFPVFFYLEIKQEDY